MVTYLGPASARSAFALLMRLEPCTRAEWCSCIRWPGRVRIGPTWLLLVSRFQQGVCHGASVQYCSSTNFGYALFKS